MKNSMAVRFLYNSILGRFFLKIIGFLHLDKIAVWFLKSPLSRLVIPWYIKNNNIPMEKFKEEKYGSFSDFFLREKKDYTFDSVPEHFISPCDGYLSVYPVEKGKGFHLKGSYYKVSDLIKDEEAASQFEDGVCFVFRLCASDYHHYCFIDSGKLEKTEYIEGQLHSVQPIACEAFPVFSLNRRVWSLLNTDNFGPVAEVEIGALVVGGISNKKESGPFFRGEKKGNFELSGSTIVLFVKKDAVVLDEKIAAALENEEEVRVHLGMCVALKK